MAGKTHWFEGQLLNHTFRTTAYTQPGTLYVALYSSAPNDDHTSGSPTGTECSGTSYARATIGTADADWTYTAGSGATAGKVDNTSAVSFATPGSGGWGTASHWGILDNSSGGNLLYWGALGTPKTINSGDTVQIAAHAMVINED